jgi:hypothetical protein
MVTKASNMVQDVSGGDGSLLAHLLAPPDSNIIVPQEGRELVLKIYDSVRQEIVSFINELGQAGCTHFRRAYPNNLTLSCAQLHLYHTPCTPMSAITN